MKYLLLFAFPLLLGLSARAQFDDSINKSDEENETSFVKGALKIFNYLEITSLVDRMRAGGVKEKSFKSVLTVDGRLFGMETGPEQKTDIFHYNVKLTSD